MNAIPIDEERIKDVISGRQQLLDRIRYRMKELYDSMVDSEELIQSIQLQSCQYGNATSRSGVKDLSDILEQQHSMQLDQSLAIRAEMWALTQEEESINRIWICYNILQKDEYEILHRLYIQEQTWDAVKADLKLNHKKMVRMRKAAMRTILYLYDSDLSNSQIALRNNRKNKIPKRKSNNDSYQLSFDLSTD